MERGRLRGASRPPRRGCARASSSRRCSRAATRRCSRTCGATSVLNLAASTTPSSAHTQHVARLALGVWDELAAARRARGATRRERELLWAAAMLHDIGTAVDYDDHHKHSRYLVLNAGLPGFTLARDRADRPDRALPPQGQRRRWASSLPLARPGDDDLLTRCSAVLRLGRAVRARRAIRRCARPACRLDDGVVVLTLEARRGRDGRPLGRRAPVRRVRARVRQAPGRERPGLRPDRSGRTAASYTETRLRVWDTRRSMNTRTSRPGMTCDEYRRMLHGGRARESRRLAFLRRLLRLATR